MKWTQSRTLRLPTWQGWIALGLLALLALLTGAAAVRNLYPFLAVQAPLAQADMVLVEGWVSDATLAAAKRELDAGRAGQICTVGVALERGQHLLPWKDWANVAAASLTAMGLPSDQVLALPGGAGQRHRTYRSLEAAREALSKTHPGLRRINLVSEGPHGRRSALVARKVFGRDTQIGVLSVPPQSYDPDRWWRSSAGVKHVLMEGIAWTYERVADSGR